MLVTASKIHDGRNWLPEGTVIEVTVDGTIIAIHEASAKEGATYYEGILVPGFVNVHCHLELSHMKGVIPEHTGLVPFLQQVMQHRFGYTDEQKKEARDAAFAEMLEQGVVAVGDIANTTDTTDLRSTGKMHFHSFIEAIGFTEIPTKQFEAAVKTYEAFAAQPEADKELRQSIVPHAPYSVSYALFRLIDAHNNSSIISIHNQESKDEDEFYISKQGGIHTLLQSLGIDDTFFHPSGLPSVQTYMRWLSPQHRFIFVHNTYTSEEDMKLVQRRLENVYWCLCPNANMYIENRLPDINMMVRDANNICIGTDSLSSNRQLSVLAELKTIKEHYPHLNWEMLLRWGTYNGAKALGMQHIIGKFEEGMQPGIIQITGLDDTPVVKRVV